MMTISVKCDCGGTDFSVTTPLQDDETMLGNPALVDFILWQVPLCKCEVEDVSDIPR